MKKKILGVLFIIAYIYSGVYVFAEETTQDILPSIVEQTSTPPTEPIVFPTEVEGGIPDPTPIPTDPIPVAPKETVFIRNGDTVVFTGDIDLPADGTTNITDAAGTSHSVNSRSVLGVLYSLDQVSDNFSLSKLEYYDSFSSFYLKCITPTGVSELCDSWQYVVGGVSPWTSVDTTLLTGGETINLYFGNPYRVTLSSSTVSTTDTLTARAESYNYLDNTWNPRTGVSIGITTVNPVDQWNPIVVSTTAVDDSGQAVLTLAEKGSYNVGVAEDFYFPSYAVSVTDPTPISSGGGGGVVVQTFAPSLALSFLTSKQHDDGSFGNTLYTDWAAVALSSMGNGAFDSKIKTANFLKNNPLSSSLVTDNERRALALMSLGINPYTGTDVNYIEKITKTFDGTQIGDSSIDNDDMFALIILKNAGYTSTDSIITKDVEHLISTQSSDGSWVGVDITAAAVQALRNYTDISGVPDAITRAENYILSRQGSDGGFGDVYATSWAVQALSGNFMLSAFISKADAYLAHAQQTDGGIGSTTDSLESRVWATSYAIPASLHRPWNSTMQSFNKYIAPVSSTQPVVSQVVTPVQPIVAPVVIATATSPIETEHIVPVIEKTQKKVLKKKEKKAVTLPVITEESVSTEPLSSSLSARVGDSVVPARSLPYRAIHAITHAITRPFVWLWVHLGF